MAYRVEIAKNTKADLEELYLRGSTGATSATSQILLNDSISEYAVANTGSLRFRQARPAHAPRPASGSGAER
jgi:hypothetical protein